MVTGVNTVTSIAAGRGRPRSRANTARTSSAIATAICPPSSGKIGSKLNIPTKIFKLATIKINVANRSEILNWLSPTA